MPTSLNEIRRRAIEFAKEWEHESSEDAEAKSFWDGFFHVMGVHRRRVATFEEPVKKGDGRQGFIDLLWKGTLLVEHKSRGRDLDRAFQQATDYFPGLKDDELPKYILVSDFEKFRLYNLEDDTEHDFTLRELSEKVHLFGFITGYAKREYKEEDPVNIKAAEMMGRLHDRLEAVGYTGHALEVYLVRLLFCLFADDTGIFDKGIFQDYFRLKTNEDGSDLAAHLAMLFDTLDRPEDGRLSNLDESLQAFPYVNGSLFKESLPPAAFDAPMRSALLECCTLDWGKISPAVFGSLFQSVMNATERRQLGAHYTSEKNILKVIKPLFLDELWAEYERVKSQPQKLLRFHEKLGTLRFLDPACGCGNFLIIAYRELRLLEMEVLKQFVNKDTSVASLSIESLMKVNVDQFYGIEIDEFASQIARVAMWLMDHQMNTIASLEFGHYFRRLPLTASATIVHSNALRLDWKEVIAPEKLSYILGNPPFVGAMVMDDGQREDMKAVFSDMKGYGVLDYVSCWYMRAIEYMSHNHAVHTALVSTNSITQGEQVGLLWRELLKRGVKIHFAHQTFRWSNDARGKAAVHCVIIGFALADVSQKRIFEYASPEAEAHEIKAKNISPYLIDAPDILLENRSAPICDVSPMRFGSMPRDGGHLIFTEEEKDNFLKLEPAAALWIRPYTGAQEFINGYQRYCLWLVGIEPEMLRALPEVMKRIEAVRDFRLSSKAATTRKFAETPALFCQIAQPVTDYLLIPRVSSERRRYIPAGFVSREVIANDQVLTAEKISPYHFGVFSSVMHMAWVRYTCGRLESRYRYSKDIVYNNFPWPEAVSEEKRKKIEECVQVVLDVRAKYPDASLADLYDPRTMPADLVKAHRDLDRAVDLTYRPQPFPTEAKRMEFLFELYQKYTAGLFVKEKHKK
ncbi:MAG: class I SAM-dependent DNA methyltransferase [Candidatus Moranbacteria bacterium]|nr:class I SAM-dependent DNA methyltransferase [Candidatus Moranbacteria bacterium]